MHPELNDRIHGLEKSSGPSRRRLYKSRYTKVPVERSALGFSSWPCSFNPSQARTRPTHSGTSQRKRKQGAYSEGGGSKGVFFLALTLLRHALGQHTRAQVKERENKRRFNPSQVSIKAGMLRLDLYLRYSYNMSIITSVPFQENKCKIQFNSKDTWLFSS